MIELCSYTSGYDVGHKLIEMVDGRNIQRDDEWFRATHQDGRVVVVGWQFARDEKLWRMGGCEARW